MVAILSPDAIPEVRFTVDEYLAADLPEGCRYELVDGVVEMSPTPGGAHDDVVFFLQTALGEHYKAHPGEIAHVSQRACVVIPGKVRVREPDLVAYRTWEGKTRGSTVWKEFVPFLVAEIVSPGQERRDRVDKREDYWIIDPHQRTFTVLTRGAKQWDETVYDQPDQGYGTPRLTDFEIRIGALFGE
jgi:Uma2 family endonuclease